MAWHGTEMGNGTPTAMATRALANGPANNKGHVSKVHHRQGAGQPGDQSGMQHARTPLAWVATIRSGDQPGSVPCLCHVSSM